MKLLSSIKESAFQILKLEIGILRELLFKL